jgi:diguanylate cyclase (GGDEF)-like protein
MLEGMSISELGAERLQAILEAQTRIAEAQLDPEGVMTVSAAEAQKLTSTAGASVELLERGELVCRAASGTARRDVGRRTQVDAGSVGQVLDSDQTSQDRGVAFAPLHRGGQVWGVLKVVTENDGPLEAEDLAALDVLSVLASTCIAHAFEFVAKEAETRTDSLTGLPTAVGLGDRISAEVARARRAGEPLSLAIFEIDGFEAITERSSEAADDAARLVAKALKAGRASDVQFRLSPSQFAVLMPATDRAGAEIAAIRLAWTIANSGTQEGKITVTSGVAQPEAEDAYAFIAEAEVALRESKATLS